MNYYEPSQKPNGLINHLCKHIIKIFARKQSQALSQSSFWFLFAKILFKLQLWCNVNPSNWNNGNSPHCLPNRHLLPHPPCIWFYGSVMSLHYACRLTALPQPRILVCKHNQYLLCWLTRHSLMVKKIIQTYFFTWKELPFVNHNGRYFKRRRES